jgi:hypothetical protein
LIFAGTGSHLPAVAEAALDDPAVFARWFGDTPGPAITNAPDDSEAIDL